MALTPEIMGQSQGAPHGIPIGVPVGRDNQAMRLRGKTMG
jgi:hypothetical protein